MIRGYDSGYDCAGMVRGRPKTFISSTGRELSLEPQLYRPSALPTELTWLWPPSADRHASGMVRVRFGGMIRVWFGYDSGMIRNSSNSSCSNSSSSSSSSSSSRRSSSSSMVWGVIRWYGLGVWFGGMIRGMIRRYDSGVWFVHVEPFSLLKTWTHNKWKGPRYHYDITLHDATQKYRIHEPIIHRDLYFGCMRATTATLVSSSVDPTQSWQTRFAEESLQKFSCS